MTPEKIYSLLVSLSKSLCVIAAKWNIPPETPQTIGWLYDNHHFSAINDWLKINVSVDFAKDFRRKLQSPLRKFHKLHFRSCQIIAEDYRGSSTEVTHCRDAIRQACDHLLYLGKLEERHKNLRQSEFYKTLYDELGNKSLEVEKGFRDAAAYLGRMAENLNTKFNFKPAAKDGKPIKTHVQKSPPKRSWTQPKLDAAIQVEKEKYQEAITKAKRGNKGAKQECLKLFARNALADRLGVKSARMISDCRVWEELAEEVGLTRKSKRGAKIGISIALEKHADANKSDGLDIAIHHETQVMIDKEIRSAKGKNAKDYFTSIRDAIEVGTMTDEAAREAIKMGYAG